MRRFLAILALLGLASCGGPGERDVVTVELYVYADGSLPGDDLLGITFRDEHGFRSLVNGILLHDEDPDKIVRVVVHELLNALAIRDHHFPDSEYGWFIYDSDTLPSGAAIPAAEAAWIEGHDRMTVKVGYYLFASAVHGAIARIDAVAPGVFVEDGG